MQKFSLAMGEKGFSLAGKTEKLHEKIAETVG